MIIPSASEASEIGINVSGGSSESIARAQDLGVSNIRRFVGWNEMEPDREGVWGTGAIAQLDELINGADANKISVTLVITNTPPWANNDPTASDHLFAPANVEQYARFVGRLAGRYRGKVASFEIWNEADEVWFWHGTEPSPAAYAPLLIASYRTIKAADPDTEVTAGPFTGNNFQFLDDLYKEGAGDSFDSVATHTDTGCLVNGPTVFYREPDDRVGRYSFLGFREVHQVLVNHGQGDKKINMSELGWSAYTGMCDKGMWAGQKAAGVGEAKQAQYLTEAYHCLSAYSYIGTALWFGDKDYRIEEEELNRYGLLRFDGSRRPAWQAMYDQAHQGDKLTTPCGHFAQPTLTVTKAVPGTLFQDQLHLEAVAGAVDGQMKRITFYLDGQRIAGANADNNKPVNLTAKNLSKFSFGDHILTISAYDQWGNKTTREVKVQRIDTKLMETQVTQLKYQIKKSGRKTIINGAISARDNNLLTVEGPVLLRWKKWIPFSRQSKGRKTKYHWATMFARSRHASSPFIYEQKLSPGRWQAVIEYKSNKPFTAAISQKIIKIR